MARTPRFFGGIFSGAENATTHVEHKKGFENYFSMRSPNVNVVPTIGENGIEGVRNLIDNNIPVLLTLINYNDCAEDGTDVNSEKGKPHVVVAYGYRIVDGVTQFLAHSGWGAGEFIRSTDIPWGSARWFWPTGGFFEPFLFGYCYLDITQRYNTTPASGGVGIAGITYQHSGVLEIPGTIDGQVVTHINNNAFANQKEITVLFFANDSQLQYIGSEAFYKCNKLTSISIPADVEAIGSGAFRGCGLLANVVFLGSRLETIGNSAFAGCTRLASFDLPSGVKWIGYNAFADTGIWNNSADGEMVYIRDWVVGYKGFLSSGFKSGTYGIACGALAGITTGSINIPASIRYINSGAFSASLTIRVSLHRSKPAEWAGDWNGGGVVFWNAYNSGTGLYEPDFGEAMDAELNILVGDPIDMPDLFGITEPTAYEKAALTLIYDRLVEINSNGDVGPGLAEQFELIERNVVQFYLRDDVYFFNGEHFVADDIMRTICYAQENPDTAAYDVWRQVEDIEIISDHSIRLILETPNHNFWYDIAKVEASIAWLSDDEGQDYPMGSGPFIPDFWAPGNYIKLIRFEDRWAGAAPSASISFRYVAEGRCMEMGNGNSDMAFGIPYIDVWRLEDFIIVDLRGEMYSLLFNFDNEILSNYLVRAAIAHCLNIEEMITALDFSFDLYETQEFWDAVDDPQWTRAMELMMEAGWEDEFTLDLVCFDSVLQMQMATIIRNQLAQIGIEVNIFSINYNEYTAGDFSSYDLILCGSNESLFLPYTERVYQLLELTDFYEVFAINNNRLVELYEMLDEMFDPEERSAILREMKELLECDTLSLTLGYLRDFYVFVQGLEGIVFAPDGTVDLRNANLIY